jgi:hypothetical protein
MIMSIVTDFFLLVTIVLMIVYYRERPQRFAILMTLSIQSSKKLLIYDEAQGETEKKWKRNS